MSRGFPQNMTALRKKRGLSQKAAAEKLEVSQALLSHYEKGIRECGLAFLTRAADFYEVTTDELLGRPRRRKGGQTPSDGADIIEALEAVLLLAARSGSPERAEHARQYFSLAIYRYLRIFALEEPSLDPLFGLDREAVRTLCCAKMLMLEGSCFRASSPEPEKKQAPAAKAQTAEPEAALKKLVEQVETGLTQELHARTPNEKD